MMRNFWSTIIQEKINGKWVFFSQQCWIAGEDPVSDAEYLKLCIGLNQTTNELRIRPGRAYEVTDCTLEDA